MLYYALVFFVIALVAAFLGFGGIAFAAAGIAKILFFLFLIAFLVSLVLPRRAASLAACGRNHYAAKSGESLPVSRRELVGYQHMDGAETGWLSPFFEPRRFYHGLLERGAPAHEGDGRRAVR